MSAPAKYARVKITKDKSWKGMGIQGDRYYESIRGERITVGASLVALEVKLASIKPEQNPV